MNADKNITEQQCLEFFNIAKVRGYREAISWLQTIGADVNVRDNTEKGKALAHYAATRGDFKAIVALTAAGANMDAVTSDGLTPVHVAVFYGHSEVISALKMAGVNMDTVMPDGRAPVHIAAAKGDCKAIIALKAAGANMDEPLLPSCQTAVHLAAIDGNPETIRTLKAVGANMNALTSDGLAPIHAAAFNGQSEVISTLNDLGMDVNKIMPNGNTALFCAVSIGHVKTVIVLLEVGADVTIKAAGLTTLELAKKIIVSDTKKESMLEIVKVLEKHESKLKRLEEKKIKDEEREQQKQEKAIQQTEAKQRGVVRKEFLDSLQSKLNVLVTKSQAIKNLSEKRERFRTEIFVTIEAVTNILKHALEGNKNNERLRILTKNSNTLDMACDLNDKIKSQVEELEVAIKDFDALGKGLKGESSESEKTILATKFTWFTEVVEALRGEVSDSKNELLSAQLPHLQAVWTSVEEKHKALLKSVGELSAMNDGLSSQWNTVKDYRILKEVANPKKENLKKKPLTQKDLDNIISIVKTIEEKIAVQIKADKDAVAAQLAEELARQHKKTTTARRTLKITVESSRATEGMPGTTARTQPNVLVFSDSNPDRKTDREERRLVHQQRCEQEIVDLNKALERSAIMFHQHRTAIAIENGVFPVPNRGKKLEHSELLKEQLECLSGVIAQTEHQAWNTESFYALLGSFAQVCETVDKEKKNKAVSMIAKRLRNASYKLYGRIKIDISHEALLAMAQSWYLYIQTGNMDGFENEEMVLGTLASDALCRVHALGKTLDIEAKSAEEHWRIVASRIDVPKSLGYVTDMQLYWKGREKVDAEETLIQAAAKAFSLAVMDSELAALSKARKRGNPEAIKALKPLKILLRHLSEIRHNGQLSRHGGRKELAKAKALLNFYKAEINAWYEYEDNDIQAILSCRLQTLRDQSDNLLLWTVYPLAAVDTIVADQFVQRLNQDKDANHVQRTLLIPCNLGNAHWVGICIEFDAANQIQRAVYIDSMEANEEIPFTLQEQFNRIYPDIQLEKQTLMHQNDSTSCGAYVIENLLLCAQKLEAQSLSSLDVRRVHLEDLRKHDLGFYIGFDDRQKNNRPTTAAIQKQLGYLSEREHTLSKHEINRILLIKECLTEFNDRMKKDLWEAFLGNEKTLSNTEAHLNHIRQALQDAIVDASSLPCAPKHKERIQSLIQMLFGRTWKVGEELNLKSLNFVIRYDELLEVTKNNAGDKNVEILAREQLQKTIDENERMAIRLQEAAWQEEPVKFVRKSTGM